MAEDPDGSHGRRVDAPSILVTVKRLLSCVGFGVREGRLALALVALTACTQVARTGAPPDTASRTDPAGPPAVTPSATGSGNWTASADRPALLAEQTAVSYGDRIYTVGGVANNARTRTVWVFDRSDGAWSADLVPPYPLAVDHAAAAVVGNTLYVTGGLTGWNQPPTAAAWTLDLDDPDAAWAAGEALPAGRGAHAVVASGRKLYVFGGIADVDGTVRNVADALVLDPTRPTDGWRSVPGMTVARDHLAAEAVDGKIYVIGGRQARTASVWDDIEGVRAEVEILDTATGAWSLGRPLPSPRAGLGSGVAGRQVVVFGGEGPEGQDGANADGAFALTHIYDPASDSWRAGAPLDVARHGIASSELDGGIHAVGGGWGLGQGPNDATGGEHERFGF